MIAKPGVQEKVLLHLLDYADFKDKVEVPFTLSQMGIANAVAIARSKRSTSNLRIGETKVSLLNVKLTCKVLAENGRPTF